MTSLQFVLLYDDVDCTENKALTATTEQICYAIRFIADDAFLMACAQSLRRVKINAAQ